MAGKRRKRMIGVALVCSAAFGLASAPLRAEEAQGAIQLVYKYNQGEVARLTTTSTGKGHTLVTGIPGQQGQPPKVPIETLTEMTMRQTTGVVHEDGSAEVAMVFDTMEVETTAENQNMHLTLTKDGVEMTVNGKKQDVPEALKGTMAFIGKQLQLKMSNRGAVLGGDFASLKGLEQFMGGMDFEQMMKMSQPSLPEKPVKPGDKWTQNMDVKLPGVAGKDGTMEANLDYTYLGMEQVGEIQCAKIDLSGTMSMEDVQASATPPGVPAGAKMTVDGMHAYMDGWLYFDPVAGRLVEQSLDMDLSVVATISGKAGDAPNAQAFQLTTETEMKMTTVTKSEMIAGAAAKAETPKAPAGN
jgi:hypothetical protein